MVRNVVRGAVAAACLSVLTGCITAYRPPAPGEPAALVKIKVAYDHGTALQALGAAQGVRFVVGAAHGANPLAGAAPGPHLVLGPAHGAQLVLDVKAESDRGTYALLQKQWPEAFRSPEPAVLDIVPALLHPGKPVTLIVRLSADWFTSEMRTVQETERIPRTVTRTDWSYDSLSKRSVPRTHTVTEWETRTKSVTKLVTVPHSAGCAARVRVRPEKDGVYLIDYSNLALTSDCTAAAYRQVMREDGTFELLPAGEDPVPGPAASL